ALDFYFSAATARRVSVSYAAAGRVKEGTEPRLGCEHAVEHNLPAIEPVALHPDEPGEGIARLYGLLTAQDHEPEDDSDPQPGHGVPTASFSTRSTTSPAVVRRPS